MSRNLDILVCRIFEICTDDFCLVQVHPAGFLYLQVLEDDVIGGKVEVVEEKYRLNSDAFDKAAAHFQSLLPDRHCQCDDRSVAFCKLNKTVCGFDGHETAAYTTSSHTQKHTANADVSNNKIH